MMDTIFLYNTLSVWLTALLFIVGGIVFGLVLSAAFVRLLQNGFMARLCGKKARPKLRHGYSKMLWTGREPQHITASFAKNHLPLFCVCRIPDRARQTHI